MNWFFILLLNTALAGDLGPVSDWTVFLKENTEIPSKNPTVTLVNYRKIVAAPDALIKIQRRKLAQGKQEMDSRNNDRQEAKISRQLCHRE